MDYGMDIATVLRRSAHRLWDAALAGGSTPKSAELRAEIETVRPGDMVAEMTTFHMPDRAHADAVGRLVACRREALRYEDAEDRDRPFGERSELTWYLELLDGRLFRWHNASFIRVLDDPMPVERRAAWASRRVRWVHDIDALAAQQEWIATPVEAVEA